jgi:hypothetical protein
LLKDAFKTIVVKATEDQLLEALQPRAAYVFSGLYMIFFLAELSIDMKSLHNRR